MALSCSLLKTIYNFKKSNLNKAYKNLKHQMASRSTSKSGSKFCQHLLYTAIPNAVSPMALEGHSFCVLGPL